MRLRIVLRMNIPTRKQVSVLRFINRFHASKGYPPTIRDICTHFGFASTKAATDHVAALMAKGLASKESRIARSIMPTDAGYKLLREA